ncbi:MAG: hypothetical protein PHG82_01055 [Candidatus Gracilibacteria bacterium]|nr:hypothetical protein [Candidatus Gracilibacteria bacterium]
MIGLLLGLIGTFFEEINNSISKEKSQKIDLLKIGIITSFFSIIIFILSLLYKFYFGNIEIHFNTGSIPLLIVRVIAEILQSYVTILAIKHSDRSTFSIIRILTIPLLLLVDIIMGYSFSIFSIIGIFIIVFSFIGFNLKLKTINFKGWYLVLFTAVNAVITMSLFKYSLSHYHNSVEIDQMLMSIGIFLFFIIFNRYKHRTCGLKLIFQDRAFVYQGVSIAIAGLLLSYTFLYMNASEASALKRAGEMFWSIISGVIFFKEKHLFKKLTFAFIIVIGLIVMFL